MPLLEANGILAETVPVATTPDAVCKTGLEALASLREAKPAAADWAPAKLAFLAGAAKLKGDLLTRIVPGVKRLVEAAGR